MAEYNKKDKYNRFKKNVAAPLVAAIMTTNAVAPAVAANINDTTSVDKELERGKLYGGSHVKTPEATDFQGAKRNLERANQDVIHHKEALKRSEEAYKELEKKHREAVSKKEASQLILSNLPSKTDREIEKIKEENNRLIIETENEIKELETGISTEESSIQDYGIKLAKAEMDRKTAALQLENVLNAISAENPDFEREYEELLKPMSELRSEIESYKNTITVSEKEIEALEQKLNQIEEALENGEKKKESLAEKGTILAEEIVEGEKRVAELEKQFEVASESIKGNEDAAKADFEENKRLYDQAKEQVDIAATAVSEAEANHRFTLDRLADAEIKLKTEQKNYGEKNAAYRVQKEKNEKAETEYEEVEHTVTALNREKNKMTAEYKKLTDDRIAADDAVTKARRQCNVSNADATSAEFDVKDVEEELNNFDVPGFRSRSGNREDILKKLENAKRNMIEKRQIAAEAKKICDRKVSEYQGIDMNWRSLHEGVFEKTAEYERSVDKLKVVKQSLEEEREHLAKVEALSSADKTKLEAAESEKVKAEKICDDALKEKNLAEKELKKAEEIEKKMSKQLDESRERYEEAKKASGETRIKTAILSRSLKPAIQEKQGSISDYKEIKKALDLENKALNNKKNQKKEIETEQLEAEATLLDLDKTKKETIKTIEKKKKDNQPYKEILLEKEKQLELTDEKIKSMADDYDKLEKARQESINAENEFNRISSLIDESEASIKKKQTIKNEKLESLKKLNDKRTAISIVSIDDIKEGKIDYSLLPEFKKLTDEYKTASADILKAKSNIISLSKELEKRKEETETLKNHLAEAKTEQAIHEKIYNEFKNDSEVTEDDKKAPDNNGSEAMIPEKETGSVLPENFEIEKDPTVGNVKTGDTAAEKLLEATAAGSASLLAGSTLLKKRRKNKEE